MSNSTSTARIVSAETVREWARKRGMVVAEHGRLNSEVVDAFNKAHKAQQYVVTRTQPARVVKVSGVRAKGNRRYTVKVETTIPQVREWAQKAGFQVGARGRISAEVVEAYATANV